MNNIDISNFRIELAVLQGSINKYAPGSANFTIPALMTAKTSQTTTPNRTENIMNQNKDLGITRITTGNYITLEVPKEYTINYPSKYVPEGTLFIVGFIGGDISTAKIIGRFW